MDNGFKPLPSLPSMGFWVALLPCFATVAKFVTKMFLGKSSARLFCHILGSEFGTLYPPFRGGF